MQLSLTSLKEKTPQHRQESSIVTDTLSRETSFSTVVRDLTEDVLQTSVTEAGTESPGQHSVVLP